MSIENLEITEEDIKVMKVARAKACQSSLFFTRYFFKKQYNKKFVIGDHHKLISDKLDAVLRGEINRLIINIAPRYGKTELAVKSFIANGLALNPSSKYIHLSYSDDLALDNSETIKDLVQSEEFNFMFPNVQFKPGSKSKKKWYTDHSGGVYATSAAGQVTGFGAGQVENQEEYEKALKADQEDEEQIGEWINSIAETNDEKYHVREKFKFGGCLIIDDPIKPEDADSETVRERVNQRFDSTISNRVNSRKTPIIIIMQRLHERDLCGYLMENEPGKWDVLSLPCIQEDEEGKEYALWPFKHTLDELKAMQARNPLVFGRQYLQNPQPKEGLLYGAFKTYTDFPTQLLPVTKYKVRKSYTDTADTGKDHLCSIAYDETDIGLFVVDIIYTKEPMEVTEPKTALQFTKHQVQYAKIESNNGGRGFARNVQDQVRSMKNHKTRIEWFHQSDNKESRIYTHSAEVNNMVYFPVGWEKRWPIFHKHVTQFMAVGKNQPDDAPDTLTGMVESIGENLNRSNWGMVAGAIG